mmetsp:Transcript_18847/g.71336  ORF Transcript_18847/g.71336 Transcript_18847/m.71336 type:complete len:1112 (-) Transcript_18847:955-4290(-)
MSEAASHPTASLAGAAGGLPVLLLRDCVLFPAQSLCLKLQRESAACENLVNRTLKRRGASSAGMSILVVSTPAARSAGQHSGEAVYEDELAEALAEGFSGTDGVLETAQAAAKHVARQHNLLRFWSRGQPEQWHETVLNACTARTPAATADAEWAARMGKPFAIGCVARVMMLRVHENAGEAQGYSLIVAGLRRVRLEQLVVEEPYPCASFSVLPPRASPSVTPLDTESLESFAGDLRAAAAVAIQVFRKAPFAIKAKREWAKLASAPYTQRVETLGDLLCAALSATGVFDLEIQQLLLQCGDVACRLNGLLMLTQAASSAAAASLGRKGQDSSMVHGEGKDLPSRRTPRDPLVDVDENFDSIRGRMATPERSIVIWRRGLGLPGSGRDQLRQRRPVASRRDQPVPFPQEGRRRRTARRPFGNARQRSESDDASEIEQLGRELDSLEMPDRSKTIVMKDFKRLKQLPPQQPEHGVLRGYLELVISLPWGNETPGAEKSPLRDLRSELDKNHLGMVEVKKRVEHFFAVRQLQRARSFLQKHFGDEAEGTKDLLIQPTILCLCGPPGVGKTSIGKSIADALRRKFVRVALGGVSDEAELRGHRRTYVGAMAGRIITALSRVDVLDPVLLLDEVDKLGERPGGARGGGDPASALLEILDPEQNHSFVDRYLNLPFDLSKVVFIATANDLANIPGPLRDRLEILQVPGYSAEEKLEICLKHLWPKQLRIAALSESHVQVSKDVIEAIIERYTREAGVRSLERQLGTICRFAAVQLLEEEGTKAASDGQQSFAGAPPPFGGARADWDDSYEADGMDMTTYASEALPNSSALGVLQGRTKPIVVRECQLESILGLPRFESTEMLSEDYVTSGMITGLAWTPTGGELLFIECQLLQGGSGQIIMTGQLGSVMRESVTIALSWIRANRQRIDSVLEKHPRVATTGVSEGDDQNDAVGAAPEGPRTPLLSPAKAAARMTSSLLDGLKVVDEHASDLHVHVPAGATPKDGPSAGAAIMLALVSLFSGASFPRTVAVTGEMTLHGRILPVGGIQQKLLAARRAGLQRIVIPKGNERDVKTLPKAVCDGLQIIPVRTCYDALVAALGVVLEGAEVRPHFRASL